MNPSITGANSTHLSPQFSDHTATEAQLQQSNATASSGAAFQEISDIEAIQAKNFLSATGGQFASKLDAPKLNPEIKSALANLSSFSDSQVSADIYSFMALFQKIAQEMRNTARTQRDTDFQGEIASLKNAAEKMKGAAEERFKAAVVQGITQIIGGVIQAGVSAYSAKQTIKPSAGAKNIECGEKMLTKISRASASNPESQVAAATSKANSLISEGKQMNAAASAAGSNWKSIGEAGSGLIAAGSGIASNDLKQQADMLDADKANLDTQAKIHETAAQQANDLMQQMMDVIRDVRDKLASIEQSQIETTRGIARNI